MILNCYNVHIIMLYYFIPPSPFSSFSSRVRGSLSVGKPFYDISYGIFRRAFYNFVVYTYIETDALTCTDAWQKYQTLAEFFAVSSSSNDELMLYECVRIILLLFVFSFFHKSGFLPKRSHIHHYVLILPKDAIYYYC